LLNAAIREALPPVASQGDRAPAVALREVDRAGDVLGVQEWIDRISLDQCGIAGIVQIEVQTGRKIKCLPVIPANVGGGGSPLLVLPTVRNRAIQEAVDPAILATEPVLHVPVGVPVQPGGEVHIVVGRPVIADVADLAVVRAVGANQIIEAELRNQDPGMPPWAHVLKNERQPEYRDIPHVEHYRPANQNVA
jgi:hypothetical protein